MSSILKGIKLNEANPHNYDSDIDYYNALNRKTRSRSEDDYVEPHDDEPIKFQQDPKARPEYSISKDEDRDAGYNMTLTVKAPTTQKAEFAADSYVDSNWGAKKQVGKITPISDGVVQVHMIDNHKYGMWKPWKDEEPIFKPISFNESAIIDKASKLLESLSPQSRTSIINELSNDLLGNYKKAASADATAADKKGDYKRGDKRFSGIVKATKKQFDNDEKKVPEGKYDSGDYYNARQGREYGAKSSQVDSGAYEFEKEMHRNVPGGEHGRPKNLKGVSKSLPADAFGRTTGKIPAGKPGRIHSMMNDVDEELDENLHKWFKEKWVRFGPDGKIRGACARGDDSEGKPKCLPQSKAQNLGKKGRASAAARKRREDPNPERSGKAINVNTKKKTNEAELDEACWKGYHKEGNKKMFGKTYPNCVKNTNEEQELNEFAPDGFNGNDGEEFNPNLAKMAYDEGVVKGAGLADGATLERAMAINDWDKHDGGIYKQHFAKGFMSGRKDKIRHNNKQYNLNLQLMKDGSIRHGEQELDEYGDTAKGQKMLAKVLTRAADRVTSKKADTDPKYAKKNQDTANAAYDRMTEEHHSESCPHCGGEMVSEELMNEKKDACYYKVKSRYKVWPSAYASGALVKCRKSGADSWGNGGKSNESIEEDDAGDVEQRMIAKIQKEKQRLAKLKQTDPEAYKREMAKRKTSGRVPPVSTFEDQGVAEGSGFDKWANDRAASQLHKLKRDHSKDKKANPAPVQQDNNGDWEQRQIEKMKKYRSPEQGVAEDQLDEKWTKKYKDSINCSNPKGFSQKAHCAGKQKNESAIMKGLK